MRPDYADNEAPNAVELLVPLFSEGIVSEQDGNLSKAPSFNDPEWLLQEAWVCQQNIFYFRRLFLFAVEADQLSLLRELIADEEVRLEKLKLYQAPIPRSWASQ